MVQVIHGRHFYKKRAAAGNGSDMPYFVGFVGSAVVRACL